MRPFISTEISAETQTLFDAVPEGILITDPHERIVYANPQVIKMTGYASSELIGKTPRVFQGAETCEQSLRRIRKALERHERIHLTVKNYTRDCSPFWVSLTIAPMFSSDGDISHFVACSRDVSVERARLARLHAIASTDVLTGMSSRRHFLHCAEAEVEKAHRYQRPLSVIVFDVDRFKSLNDGAGHAFGDQVLARIGVLCKQLIRDSDLLGRIGGDEFAVLLPETQHAPAIWTADRLRRLVREDRAHEHPDRLQITISLGVATLDMRANESLTQCLARADAALYRAKASGRDACAGDQPETVARARGGKNAVIRGPHVMSRAGHA